MHEQFKKDARDWLEAFICAPIVLAALFFFCWPFQVQGVSMMDTLRSNDRIVVSRFTVLTGSLSRGDMVVCTITDGDNTARVVKRLVGLPSDHVVITNGRLYINGNLLDEPYLNYTVTYGNTNLILDDDEYFVLGDNRMLSFDSRLAGPVQRGDIIGRVFARWYPFWDFELY